MIINNLTIKARLFLIAGLFIVMVPSAFALTINFATGQDADGNIQLTGNSLDANWKESNANNPKNAPNSYVVAPGNNNWGGDWLANGPKSSWIAPNPDDASGNGMFTLTYTFDLTGYDLSSASFANLKWSIDDGGVVKLNGHTVASLAWYNWGNLHVFTIPIAYLLPTVNKLTITVTSTDNVIEAARLEGILKINALAHFLSLGDINNDTSPEIAAVTHDAAVPKTTATVKNAQTGALVKQMPFDGQFEPKRVAVVPDLNANGATEIAVLGIRSSDQAVQVEIRDSLSGAQLSTVPFPSALPSIALSVLRDSRCGSKVCLAVLQQNDTVLQVQLKDALSGTAIRNIPFSDGYNGKGLGIIADLNGNKKRELVLLADAKTPGPAYQLEIRDSKSGALIRTVSFPADEPVKGLLNLGDLNQNGGVELASLLPHIPQVMVIDTKTGATLNTITTTLIEPYLMSRENDSGNEMHITLFGTDASNGEFRAEVYDALTGANLYNIVFTQPGITVSLRRIPDINGNGSSELVRQVEQQGASQSVAEIRDGATGVLINTVDF